MQRESHKDNSGSSWKLEGRMSIITESWTESRILTQLNIPVTKSLIPQTRKTLMNGSWLQDIVKVRKAEQPNKTNIEVKKSNPEKLK